MKYWITKEESSTMYMYVPVVSLKICAAVLEFLRRHLKFQPMRTHYGPWQSCWISNQHQKHKSGTMTRLSLTLDPMGISHFHLFF
jgi:hypothetical protein